MATVTDKAVTKPAPGIAPRATGKARARLQSTTAIIALRILVILVAIVLWQVMSGPVVPEYAVSKPTDVYDALTKMLGSASGWTDIKVTAIEVLAGFGLGVLAGTVMGLVLGSFPLLGRVLEPLVAALNGIPKIALAPLFLLFFGIGSWSKITIAMTGVAFVVFYNVYLGLRLRERELVEVVQVMGGRRHHVLGYVTIPTLAAPFFAALKTGGPLAILGVIGGEFIASSEGVGHELFTAAQNLDAAAEFAGLIVLVVMTLALNGVLTALDAYALKRLGLAARRRPRPKA
ncbi:MULTISPECIES: ABC transporter permease [unclassified Streptomyces]|jgi:NitT/TauT family transport system permease protein|uniref:ABC transporter permease n=1 Tax=unclassified Streptomyces TaxID=2593676 RepID=UPI000D423D65|nr:MULTISPECIES: ABC transporter permease [unclassified Streptomyces]PTM86602.1 NitT/TauT family transport system permease protein [Streptomyces sp. VMFN-G11Ma]